MELWAFASPYAGVAMTGYKLAEYTLGQLNRGFYYSNISSGTIAFAPPPDGTWALAMFVTEYIGSGPDGGYTPRSYVNFPTPVVFGQPGPPPPAVTPQVGAWWNPNESGTGYSIDYRHGVLVILVYSYQSNGTPQWYLATGPLSGYTFTSPLTKFVNGQCIYCTYSSPTTTGSDGTMTIVFSSATLATVYLPGGRVTQIQPDLF